MLTCPHSNPKEEEEKEEMSSFVCTTALEGVYVRVGAYIGKQKHTNGVRTVLVHGLIERENGW